MNYNEHILNILNHKRIIKKRDNKNILDDINNLSIPIEKYLVLKEITNDSRVAEAIGSYLSIPYVDIDMLEIDDKLLSEFTFDLMKRNHFIPVKVDSDTLIIATPKPLDLNAISSIRTVYTNDLDYIFVSESQIDRYLDSKIAVIETTDAIKDLNDQKYEEIFKQAQSFDIKGSLNREDEVLNNPSVKIVDSIIKEAIPFRASDIHIEPFEKTINVRYRIDGDLQQRAEIPIDSYSAICARLKIMSGMNIAERRVPQDGRINMIVAGKEYDFRTSCIPTIYGEKFVIRILDKTSFNFSREELGFTESENKVIDKILAHPHGIVLLTGPTGSGKTTTLYSFLKEVNKKNVNIVTVEDPVEYTMNGVNQTQVNVKANMTFANALRSILRQDPDIIMIGEIRDEETAEIAVRSAITGHLVFSTLHTNDAVGAIVRLEDMGVPDYLVSDAVVGVVAQRLVKKLCPACKKRYRTSPKEMELLGISEATSIFKEQGCQFCNYTGYKGRTAVHEILYLNEKLKNTVVNEKNTETLRKVAIKEGMVPLKKACSELVLNGETSMSEMLGIVEE